MKRPSFPRPIEILESRIVLAQGPRTIFLGGLIFSAYTATVPDVNVAADAAAVGAELAVIVNKGDTVVFDTNGNKVADPGEIKYLQVTGGSAELFARNVINSGAVDPSEIFGMMVSDGFKATITGDVNGPIVTALDNTTGAITPAVLQHSSIASLTVSGHVSGAIIAGGSIAKVNIGAGTADPALSVDAILTGTAASGVAVSYSSSGTISSPVFTATDGAAGGNISNVTLAHGANRIGTGDGGISAAKNGGPGGDVTAITISDSTAAVNIFAGNGGASTAPAGKGGEGGMIGTVTALFHASVNGSVALFAGEGGLAKSPGNGGAVSAVTLTFATDAPQLDVTVVSGEGGGATPGSAGPGADGGNLGKVTIKSDGHTLKRITVSGLSGSSADTAAGGNGAGGDGGKVDGVTIDVGALPSGLFVGAGSGGDGFGKGAGGKGGVANNIDAKIGNTAVSGVVVNAGDGGKGGADGTSGKGGDLTKLTLATGNIGAGFLSAYAGSALPGAKGGNGGNVSVATITAGTLANGVSVSSGGGGEGLKTTGGNGGMLKGADLTVGSGGMSSSMTVNTGNGGRGFTQGGKGGDLSGVTPKATGNIGSVDLRSGDGGEGTGPKGKGGNAGAIATLTVETGSVSSNVGIATGAGGTGDGGDGGDGGKASKIDFKNNGSLGGGFFIGTGGGGDGAMMSGAGKGGDGGALATFHFNNQGGNMSDFGVDVGDGGGGSSGGGNGGDLTGLTVDSPATATGFIISAGDGGACDDTGNGGTGGDITKLAYNVAAGVSVGSFDVEVGAGGAAADGGGVGKKGGNSGKVDGVTFDAPTAVAVINSDSFTGGGAGAGGAKGKGGDGGDIANITGKIGTLSVIGVNGGGGAGVGGSGGDVSKIKLTAVGSFVRILSGGDGGGGTVTAGKGGNVSAITLPSGKDIGDFSSAFAADSGSTSMGGLFAGLGGMKGGIVQSALNGSISGIDAGRIAAILAGRPASDAITADNAVTKISGLKNVTAIGADVNTNTMFTFTDNATGPHPNNGLFLLGDGDTAIDGLVVVKTGGFTPPAGVTPLKLITV